MKRCALWGSLFLIVFSFLLSCKKSPTTATIDLGENAIILACNPSSDGPDTTLTVAVVIAKNAQEICVFGLEMSIDTEMFQFHGCGNGNLTGSWAAVDGNELTPGTVRIGGFSGGGSPIARNSQGAITQVRLKVTGTNYGNGQQSQICIRQYTDDLSGF